MKKLILILLCLPMIGFGQDVPLIEQKVTTNKMEEKDKKKQDQIYIAPIKDRSFIADGKKDAKLHYHYKNCGRNLTGIISAFNPLVALIPATAYSLSAPKDKNLNYPSQQLMNSQEYNKAYRKQAHRMKKKRVWVMLGVGALINLGIWAVSDNQ